MSIQDLSDTIIAKSDQLNADDLIGASKTITLTNITRYQEAGVNCFSINYEGDCGRPFKPCKSMRRVILFAWGANGSEWIGRSMTLYCDPDVKYGGKAVGGVRISHMSNIEKRIKINITQTRHVKKEMVIDVLQAKQRPTWPDDKLAAQIAKATSALQNGTVTHEQVITKLEVNAMLTDEQKQLVRNIEIDKNPGELSISDDDFNE